MFLEQVVHGKWLWEGDELAVFPRLMECQSSHNGAVDVITSFVRLRHLCLRSECHSNAAALSSRIQC